MHPHEELAKAMMEAILEHPEKTLTEIVREMMRVFGNHFHILTICRYFQRNGATRKTVSFTSILLYHIVVGSTLFLIRAGRTCSQNLISRFPFFQLKKVA